MKKLKVGDKIVVTNGIHDRNGRVIAIVNGTNEYVVTHESFNEKMCSEDITQLFNSDDGQALPNGHVKLKLLEIFVSNIYPDTGAMMFQPEIDANLNREIGCLGYIKADKDMNTGEFSNLRFTSFEDK